MTITDELVEMFVENRRVTQPPIPHASWGVHCRTGDCERCSMVCACPHHLVPRGTSWALLSASERGLVLIEGGEG